MFLAVALLHIRVAGDRQRRIEIDQLLGQSRKLADFLDNKDRHERRHREVAAMVELAGVGPELSDVSDESLVLLHPFGKGGHEAIMRRSTLPANKRVADAHEFGAAVTTTLTGLREGRDTIRVLIAGFTDTGLYVDLVNAALPQARSLPRPDGYPDRPMRNASGNLPPLCHEERTCSGNRLIRSAPFFAGPRSRPSDHARFVDVLSYAQTGFLHAGCESLAEPGRAFNVICATWQADRIE